MSPWAERSTIGPYQRKTDSHILEDSYSVTRILDGHMYHLHLTDTAGQEEYRGLFGASNLQTADAFLLVYDITKPSSLQDLQHFVQLIEIEKEQRLDRGGIEPVRIIAGNKCDLQAQRQVKATTGIDWARAHGCGFMETSARNMVNIEETFARESIALLITYAHPVEGTRDECKLLPSLNTEIGSSRSPRGASSTYSVTRERPVRLSIDPSTSFRWAYEASNTTRGEAQPI